VGGGGSYQQTVNLWVVTITKRFKKTGIAQLNTEKLNKTYQHNCYINYNGKLLAV